MEKKNDHQQEEEKKELIKTIESVKLDDSGVVSKLLTQQQDPIVTIEKELKIKFDQDMKDALKQVAVGEEKF